MKYLGIQLCFTNYPTITLNYPPAVSPSSQSHPYPPKFQYTSFTIFLFSFLVTFSEVQESLIALHSIISPGRDWGPNGTQMIYLRLGVCKARTFLNYVWLWYLWFTTFTVCSMVCIYCNTLYYGWSPGTLLFCQSALTIHSSHPPSPPAITICLPPLLIFFRFCTSPYALKSRVI